MQTQVAASGSTLSAELDARATTELIGTGKFATAEDTRGAQRTKLVNPDTYGPTQNAGALRSRDQARSQSLSYGTMTITTMGKTARKSLLWQVGAAAGHANHLSPGTRESADA